MKGWEGEKERTDRFPPPKNETKPKTKQNKNRKQLINKRKKRKEKKKTNEENQGEERNGRRETLQRKALGSHQTQPTSGMQRNVYILPACIRPKLP